MTLLHSRTVPVAQLTADEVHRMSRLFEKYYDCTSFPRFVADLRAKDDVILLCDDGGRIQGFSTLKNLAVTVDGRRHYGLFSGDTVVDRAFWGQRVLGQAFLRYLFRQKARHPLHPFWWFLISKGYKTYLLMANNFTHYYPHPERATPRLEQSLLDAFGAAYFGSSYDPASGLITFAESLGQLKPGVADITPELLESPRIAFFARRNPTWAVGTELACIARMTWSMPVFYAIKARLKSLMGRRSPRLTPRPIPASLEK